MKMALAAVVTAALTGCGNRGNAAASTVGPESRQPQENSAGKVTFDADSAFKYVKAQTDFGPRVPGTEAHRRCGAMLAAELKRLGADTVLTQEATVTAFDGTRLPIVNIMGRFNPEAPMRVLLAAHWDSRPWADSEEDETARLKPIDGANDGASGTGVLMEVARQLASNPLPAGLGVDILMVDAEDYGTPSDSPRQDEDSWCLGTQYFIEHMPYKPTQLPIYGIVLDMVGGRDAKFHREYFSQRLAYPVVNRVWAEAIAAGYGDRFINSTGGAITDDHIYLNKAGIPTIDIIENDNELTGSFNPTWHTLDDTIENIDPATLGVVGQTVLNTIYNTKK
ncbi:MAG: M28 family peptidase [Muribaculaceae bacterium]|nr:M28 family peptidase [Muribaculaceae bacterium]